MWLLAIKSMLADRGKLLTSLLGVSFAVVLVNLQGGLFLGLMRKASLLIDYGQADVWVGHRHMNNVDMGSFVPERWVHRLRAVDGVERADAYVVAGSVATMPDGRTENVLVVGCDPASMLGNAWLMVEGDARGIRHPEGVLVDACNVNRLGDCRVGDVREINGHRARVVGLTRGITGFTSVPYVFTTVDRARAKYGLGIPPGQCSYFLVKAKPGTDPHELCERLRQRVPELDAYTRDDYSRMSVNYWLTRTGIGISFGLAAFLGLLVGLAVVAQTLYAAVTERVKEFGTLKAMGADDGCVARFVVAQALGSAVLGSAVGLLAAVLTGLGLSSPQAPVVLTWQVAALSVGLTLLVCLAASWAPYWRIRRIDPASVLRG